MVEYFKKLSLRTKLGGVLIIVLLASLIYNWYTPSAELPPKVPVKATETKVAAKVEKVEVPATKLVTYKKSEVIKKVKLPEDVVKNPDAHVTKSVDVPPSKAGSIATAVTDTKTGVTDIYVEAKPIPFWGFENEKRLGLGYSVSTSGAPVIDVHAEYTAVRAGDVYLSVRGEVNTRSEIKGTVNAEYRK